MFVGKCNLGWESGEAGVADLKREKCCCYYDVMKVKELRWSTMPGRITRSWAVVCMRLEVLTHEILECGAHFGPTTFTGDMLDCVVPAVVVVAMTSDVDWHRRRLPYKDSGSAFGIRWTEQDINLHGGEGFIQRMSSGA
jgi:hypothetical protein